MSTTHEAITNHDRLFDLSDEQLKFFHDNGYLGPFTMYEPDEMAQMWRQVRRQLFDRSKAAYAIDANASKTSIANYDRHLDNSLLSRHVCRPEIVHRVRSILGDDVLCWRSEFFPKYKGDEGTEWHQADTFAHATGKAQIVWPEDSEFGGAITVWTAFTPATEKTGCLRFIPGTHKTRYYDESKGMTFSPENNSNVVKDGMRRGFFGYDYRQLQIDPNWTPDESKAISMVMRPGQFVIFWTTLMHSSFPNTAEDGGCAWASPHATCPPGCGSIPTPTRSRSSARRSRSPITATCWCAARMTTATIGSGVRTCGASRSRSAEPSRLTGLTRLTRLNRARSAPWAPSTAPSTSGTSSSCSRTTGAPSKIVGDLNGQYVKVSKLKGEFMWHQHDNEDEMFLVLKGTLRIVLKDREIVIREGEFTIVPKGVQHKPIAEDEVHVMLFEPKSTLTTGNIQNEQTTAGEWI